MDLNPTVIAVLTSVPVSGATTFLLHTYLAKRVEHHFARQLERYRAELAVRIHTEHGVATRRLEGYPKIVELSYRTRNMAKDLASASRSSVALRNELLARAKELEDHVFRFRIDLEADGVFLVVHRYKNLILEFTRALPDPGSPDDSGAHLSELAGQIDRCYTDVVDKVRLPADLQHGQEGA